MAGKFEPKVPVNLDPPKDDPITLEELAKADGRMLAPVAGSYGRRGQTAPLTRVPTEKVLTLMERLMSPLRASSMTLLVTKRTSQAHLITFLLERTLPVLWE
nr:steroid-binding protein 3 [Colletotrichum truncatum]KAF6801403.1 steroid-binding protein 3 [Colletotrichum truncatum]